MFYITGDTHGDLNRLAYPFVPRDTLTREDWLIVAGDFGYIWGDRLDASRLEQIAALPYNIAFLDGNHECFPQIFQYPEETLWGGRVHRILPNLVHLMRGQVFSTPTVCFFTMGGGYSLDKAMRREGLSWWKEELPTEEEYETGLRNLQAHGNRVDVLLSHAAPADTMYMLQQIGRIGKLCYEECRLNEYLQLVEDTVEYKRHYFGHLHLDEQLWRDQVALLFHV